jgi:hypothetical protein
MSIDLSFFVFVDGSSDLAHKTLARAGCSLGDAQGRGSLQDILDEDKAGLVSRDGRTCLMSPPLFEVTKTGRGQVELDSRWDMKLAKTSMWNGPIAYILLAGSIDGGQLFYWEEGSLKRAWACHDGECFLKHGTRIAQEPDFAPARDPSAAAHMTAAGFGFPPDDEAYRDDAFEVFDLLA